MRLFSPLSVKTSLNRGEKVKVLKMLLFFIQNKWTILPRYIRRISLKDIIQCKEVVNISSEVGWAEELNHHLDNSLTTRHMLNRFLPMTYYCLFIQTTKSASTSVGIFNFGIIYVSNYLILVLVRPFSFPKGVGNHLPKNYR